MYTVSQKKPSYCCTVIVKQYKRFFKKIGCLQVYIVTPSPVIEWSILISVFVCLSASISSERQCKVYRHQIFFCLLPMAVPRASVLVRRSCFMLCTSCVMDDVIFAHNYFASAAVAVDSSHMTASSSASWSRFSPPSNFVNGHLPTMVHGLSVATITGR